jgi:hypothetical protein
MTLSRRDILIAGGSPMNGGSYQTSVHEVFKV